MLNKVPLGLYGFKNYFLSPEDGFQNVSEIYTNLLHQKKISANFQVVIDQFSIFVQNLEIFDSNLVKKAQESGEDVDEEVIDSMLAKG